MKYIFLFFCMIFWLFAANSFEQMKVDSIIIHIDSLLVHSYGSFQNGPLGTSSYDTTEYRGLNIHFIIGISDQKPPFPSVTFELDSVTNLIKSFRYAWQDIEPTYQNWENFTVSNIPYLQMGADYQSAISNIPDSFFHDNLFHYERGSNQHMGVDINSSSNAIGLKIAGGVNTITIFGSLPLNSVPQKIDNEEINCTPNPASNFITLPIKSVTLKDISFLDLLGRTMLTYPVNSGAEKIRIDISSLPPGIYYLRAGNQMQKFVIQR